MVRENISSKISGNSQAYVQLSTVNAPYDRDMGGAPPPFVINNFFVSLNYKFIFGRVIVKNEAGFHDKS